MVNEQLGYDWGNVQVWVNANNLLNETYTSRVTDTASGQLTLGVPKHVSVNKEATI